MKLLRGLLGVAFVVLIGGINSYAVEAISPWVSGAESPVITNDQGIPLPFGDSCQTFHQTLVIAGVGERLVCVYGEKIKLVTYMDQGGGSKIAVGVLGDSRLYPVHGICETIGLDCRYSEAKDLLLAREYGNYPGTQAVIYQDFIENLQWRFDSTTLAGYFQLSERSKREVIAAHDGTVIPTGAIALSENGSWAVLEIINKGTALVDTSAGVARRIIAPGRLYGRGMDPREEMAVTNDGSTVVITGRNTGFTIVTITGGCGQVIIAEMSESFSQETMSCPQSDAGVGLYEQGFRFGHHPRFGSSDTALNLGLVTTSYAERQLRIRPFALKDQPSLEYLGLGDSFSSGEGELSDEFYLPMTNTLIEKCHTSRRSYPFLVATQLSIPSTSAQSVACSGARIPDVVKQDDSYRGQSNRFPKERITDEALDSLKAEAMSQFIPGRIEQSTFVDMFQPRIITVGLGGNDSGLIDKLRSCAMPSECEWVDDDKLAQTASEFARLFDPLVSTYKRIHSFSPHSTLYVIGYPQGIDSNGECDTLTGLLLNEKERRFMSEALYYLNDVIEAAAQTAGAIFIDVENAYEAKVLCGTDGDKAVNGFRYGDDSGLFRSLPLSYFIGNETFHPTPLGHSLVAQRIAQEIQRGVTNSCNESNVPCTEITAAPIAPPFWHTGASSGIRTVQTELIRRHDDTSLEANVAIQKGAFLPHSQVRLEIHSEPTFVGDAFAASDGSVEASISLPDTLTDGYHTLHAYGVSVTGAELDLYQTIRYQSLPKVTQKKEAVIPELSYVHVGSQRIEIGLAQSRNNSIAMDNIPGERVVLGVTTQGIQWSTARETRIIHHTINFWWLRVFGLVGIIVVCLLFALRLKK